MSFLHETARALYEKHGTEMHRVVVVFPSQRAAVFFRQALQDVLPGPAFAPQLLTLNDFVFRMSNLCPADPVRLLFALYQEYRKLLPERDEGFAGFSTWGNSLLRDFAETDNYLLDPDAVFGFLNQEKAIELWQPDRGTLSEYEQNYLDFYRELGNLYHRLREKLLKDGKAYPALAARMLAEKWAKDGTAIPWEYCWFCGFNALNSAEITLFKQLAADRKASFRWDGDRYYLDNEQHEAGLFLRRLLDDNDLMQGYQPGDHFREPKKIHLVQAAGQLAQVKAASGQLARWQKDDPYLHRTVLVLADESLLVPMLSSLPEKLGKLNVTMGYPSRLGQAYQLVNLLMRLMNNRKIQADGPVYGYRDVLPLLQLPLLRKSVFSRLSRELIESRRVRIPYTLLAEAMQILPALDRLLKTPDTSPGQFPALVIPLLEELADGKHIDFLQQQLCLQLITLLRRFEVLLEEEASLPDWSLLLQLWQQFTETETLDFLGEPLEGLQLMGLLETRTLDFDRVLIVGVNEGKLPGKASQHSFITATLRYNFGLPGPREKEAVFAYHFYRLLQRSKEVVLTYNGVQDDFGGGEPSRYLQQLRFELTGNRDIQLVERSISPILQAETLQAFPIKISQDAALRSKIKDRLIRGLSPTAISNYINCSLQFYFAQLEGLQEEDTLAEHLDHRSIGTVLHRTLELLYEPHLNKPLRAAQLQEMKTRMPAAFHQALEETMHHAPTDEGLNLLIREVCRDYLERFLAQESVLQTAGGQELTVLASEEKLMHSLNIDGQEVVLKGTADRIDQVNGLLRITDYKTGNFTNAEIELSDVATELWDPKKIKAMQLLSYAWLYHQKNPETTVLQSGIWSFRLMTKGLVLVKVDRTDLINQEILAQYETFLTVLLRRLLDPESTFTQTEDQSICEKCNFRQICMR